MINRFLALTIIVLLSTCSNQSDKVNEKQVNTSQTIYFNGEIVTMEEAAGATVEAVVSAKDRVVFTGSLAAAQKEYPNAQNYNLEGKTMMPGFIEQHLHPFLAALTLAIPVIAPENWELPSKTWEAAKNKEEYLEKLQQINEAAGDSNEALFTWGYHQYFHGEMSRKILDEVSEKKPILVWHRSCHEFYMNTAALEKYGITQAEINKMGEEVQQQASMEKGHFFENGAIFVVLPKIISDLGNLERFRMGLEQMIEMLHHNGVTAYHEPGAFIMDHVIPLYKEVLGAEDVPMYSFFTPQTKIPYYEHGKEGVLEAVQEITTMFPKEGKIRFFDNQIKMLADGAIVSQAMKMKDGYLDGHHGEWMQTPEDMEVISKIFWNEGYQILIHVNGDLGLEEVLNIVERRMKEHPRKDHRTTIIHFANSTEEQVQKIADLGCIVSVNPYYVTGFSDKYAEIGLGHDRAHAMVRSGSVEKLGISYSVHSDLPIAPADPLYLAWCASNRKTNNGNIIRPDLAISLHGALKAITIDAAFSWQMEKEIGSIKEGKIANFTILEQNPYKVGAEQLKDINVWGTVFEGRLFPIKTK